MTNHDTLQQVYLAIYDDGGLRQQLGECRKEIAEISNALVGTLETPGLIPKFQDHLDDHKRTVQRMGMIASALGGASGLLVELAHRLGLL